MLILFPFPEREKWECTYLEEREVYIMKGILFSVISIIVSQSVFIKAELTTMCSCTLT
jgi:hypothetical protein